MNKLDKKQRAQVVSALVEGNSIRATARMPGVAGGACRDVDGRIVEHLAMDHAHAPVSGRLGPFVSAKGGKPWETIDTDGGNV